MSKDEEGVEPEGINPPSTQLLDRRIDAALDKRGLGSTGSDLQSGGPGTPGGGDLEARIAKVEASVEHIVRDVGSINEELRTVRANSRSDFRLIFGAIIAVALGLAGLMAKGFHWIG